MARLTGWAAPRFPAMGRRVRGRASPRESSMHPAFATRSGTAVPIWFVNDATWPALRQAFDAPVRSFADASGFEPKPAQWLLLPGAGGLSGVLFGLEPAGKPPADPFLAGPPPPLPAARAHPGGQSPPGRTRAAHALAPWASRRGRYTQPV